MVCHSLMYSAVGLLSHCSRALASVDQVAPPLAFTPSGLSNHLAIHFVRHSSTLEESDSIALSDVSYSPSLSPSSFQLLL